MPARPRSTASSPTLSETSRQWGASFRRLAGPAEGHHLHELDPALGAVLAAVNAGSKSWKPLNPLRMALRAGISKLGAKGDKAFEQSISNALAALFNSKSASRENGRYRAA
jgi:hypothetical protein